MKQAARSKQGKVVRSPFSRKLETGFENVNKNIVKILFTGVLLLMFTSCEKEYWGYDGFDGRAYLALSWTDAEPDYIEPGTQAIPNIFYWDEYYRINPGIYTMYYDGDFWDGYGWIDYAWEVDYEIWINYGEPGDINYDGLDGADNYFVLECNPFGPDLFLDLKSKAINKNIEVLESSENKKSLLIKKEFFSMKVTYRKVEKRAKIQQEARQ